MSGLSGWFDRERTGSVDPSVAAAMAAPLTRFDGSSVRSVANGFGTIAAAAAAGGVDIHADGERLVAVWGRARLADASLGEVVRLHGVACALAQGYARRGASVLTSLTGAFALAILDGGTGEALLAIDRMGTRPLSYRVTAGVLVFGSTLEAIGAFAGIPPEIDRQAIYDYVYFHMVPGPHTIRSGCHRLLPGSFLRWRGGKAETRLYWEMRFVEGERRPMPELRDDFLAAVRTGVAEAAQEGTVGSFLSGGTDSTTVAGM